MMDRIYFGSVSILILALISGCETKIHPTLQEASPVYIVDGWINNKKGPQLIILTQSQSYFDNTLPPGVSGAVVRRTGISTSSAEPARFALARAARSASVVLARLAHFSRAGVIFAALRANALFSFFESSSCSSSTAAAAIAEAGG